MAHKIITQPLTQDAFLPYGQIIEKTGAQEFPINDGKCTRHHALAEVEIDGGNAKSIISIFSSQPYALPHLVSLVERHPLGSQAFYPLGSHPWLVIVCDDDDGQPHAPKCFFATANQGINLRKNVWHGVLTPLMKQSDFIVVDRAGDENNLEEHHFDADQRFVIEAIY